MKSRRLIRAVPLLLVVCFASFAHGEIAYVSNEDSHTVSVIDFDKGAAIATVEVGKRPRGLKLSHDGSKLYVAVSGTPKCAPSVPDEECEKLKRDLEADGIAVVDTRSHKVLGVLAAGSDPEQFDFTADGTRLFVANEDEAKASIVDVQSGKVLAQIPVGREPEGVGIDPSGKWALVTNEADNSVSIIDAERQAVVRSIVVGKRPRSVAFTSDGKYAYVTGEFDASLYRIRIPEGDPVERVAQFDAKARPMTVLLDEPRKRLYVSTGRGGTVAILEPSGGGETARLVKEIPVGTRPWGMALSSDGRRLYTANGPSNDVTVIDTQSLQVLKKIPVGKSPWGIDIAR